MSKDIKEVFKKQLEEKGFVSVSVDLRSVKLKPFLKKVKKEANWVNVERIVNLEGKPLMAIVHWGLDKSKEPKGATIIENLTEDDKLKMIAEHLKWGNRI